MQNPSVILCNRMVLTHRQQRHNNDHYLLPYTVPVDVPATSTIRYCLFRVEVVHEARPGS